MTAAPTQFAFIPETVLPGGRVVPAFRVATCLASKKANGSASIAPEAKPWLHVNYLVALQAARAGGMELLRLSQRLAIAFQLSACDRNWSGGKVGEGLLKRGRWELKSHHAGTIQGLEQAKMFHLPDGQVIMDFAGHCHEWVFDDIHGDVRGVVNRRFAPQDESLIIPYPAEQKGQGATPRVGANWTGLALRCGGSSSSQPDGCGLFNLSGLWPYNSSPDTSFRCVLPASDGSVDAAN